MEEKDLAVISKIMKSFFSPLPLWQNNGLAVIRIVVGGFLIYHGCEMFDTPVMNEYFKWDMFKDSSTARISVYGAKLLSY
jgi:putative oxidoreductase